MFLDRKMKRTRSMSMSGPPKHKSHTKQPGVSNQKVVNSATIKALNLANNKTRITHKPLQNTTKPVILLQSLFKHCPSIIVNIFIVLFE